MHQSKTMVAVGKRMRSSELRRDVGLNCFMAISDDGVL